jgi:hypothetical protein
MPEYKVTNEVNEILDDHSEINETSEVSDHNEINDRNEVNEIKVMMLV